MSIVTECIEEWEESFCRMNRRFFEIREEMVDDLAECL